MNGRPFKRDLLAVSAAHGALRTVRDLMRWAVTQLRSHQVALGHGTQDAWDEAAWLILWALYLPPDDIAPYLDAQLMPQEVERVLALLARRCQERVPTAYLIGEAWLRGERFICDPRALVPRSPIAEILDSEDLAAWFNETEGPHHILDLCTGGGSLAILAAQHFVAADVVATDLSPSALALAQQNCALHGLNHRISFFEGDVWDPLVGLRFDLILCNPPYVNQTSMDSLPAEYRAEPIHALAGGPDGMTIIRRILAGAAQHLNPDGVLVLEIGHEARHFEAAFPELAFLWLPVAGGSQQIVLIEQSALNS